MTKKRARQEYHGRIKELNDLLSQTSAHFHLYQNSRVSFIAPKMDTSRLKYIELAKVSETQLLVIIVTNTAWSNIK